MGNLLETPIVDKETHSGVCADGIEWAVSSMQGYRVEMEDAHICQASNLVASVRQKGRGGGVKEKISVKGHALFAVLDGHGGAFAAKYASQNLCRVLGQHVKFVRYAKHYMTQQKDGQVENDDEEEEQINLLKEALRDTFVALDREIYIEVMKGTPFKEEDTASSNDEHYSENDLDATIILEAAHDLPISNPQQPEEDSGTTLCLVLTTPKHIICANTGDSRAILACRGDSSDGINVAPLSFDHKPDNPDETERIQNAGGSVMDRRVDGDLAVSRCLGDYRFKDVQAVLNAGKLDNNHGGFLSRFQVTKTEDASITPETQKVSPVPDVLVRNRDGDADLFLVCACDGIWDVRTNLECVETVTDIFAEGESNIALVCEELLDYCLEIGSKDNMTALILKFPAQDVGEGGGVAARRERRERLASALKNDE